MRIEAYFRHIHETVGRFPFVLSHNITCDKRGTHEGFVRGEFCMADGSVLHIREFVDVELRAELLAYAYQHISAEGKLVFRYDNTGHHKNLGLSTYPHHKHNGSESNVIAATEPTLRSVLQEIGDTIEFPKEARDS